MKKVSLLVSLLAIPAALNLQARLVPATRVAPIAHYDESGAIRLRANYDGTWMSAPLFKDSILDLRGAHAGAAKLSGIRINGALLDGSWWSRTAPGMAGVSRLEHPDTTSPETIALIGGINSRKAAVNSANEVSLHSSVFF